MKKGKMSEDAWTLSIFVPQVGAEPTAPPDPSAETHSIRDIFLGSGRIERVDGHGLEAQWTQTVGSLMKLSSAVGERTKDWTIDEIEVGLTLSAKGELLFIAEAGAEASIKFMLKRKDEDHPELKRDVKTRASSAAR
jgi:hypothetical protein